ncbi:MAG: HlyD family efflux transporter periplasmic adaptor subunit [Proteobacteria bacterium]|nr:HlyD family efflux transporter periplasmic adaptor subunit [Desulfobacula sp.]MBU3950686.1 HlyD family efflux transporter periplasmic adaptor subunit [Pseudomonadota bacterium]MBU4130971.1 HlyD family efflux transporter periplasmic adaptor subunit [Pseudomonadota bacterium]
MATTPRFKAIASFLFKLFRVLIVLGIAFLLAFWLYAIRSKPVKKELVQTPPSVKVFEAHSRSEVMTVEAFGTVSPRTLVKIAVEVPGRIAYLNPGFLEGGLIENQDLLVQIDPQSYGLGKEAAAVHVAQARVDIDSLNQEVENLKNDMELAKANVILTEKELGRMTALNQNQFASKTSLDKAEQQHLAARIQLQTIQNRRLLIPTMMEQKKAALAMANVEFDKAALALERTRILSGFDGFVLDKQAEVGEYVNVGQVLGAVYEKDALDVEVKIPLEQMRWIQTFFDNGRTPAARVSIANFNDPEKRVWEARVARIKASIDEKTRTLPMTLEIQSKDGGNGPRAALFDLKPGTFVNCKIIGETRENIFVLPRHLLKPGDVLFVVTDSRLEMRRVEVLRKFEEEVYINGGLANGDKIIASPLPGAIEGMELSIKENGLQTGTKP